MIHKASLTHWQLLDRRRHRFLKSKGMFLGIVFLRKCLVEGKEYFRQTASNRGRSRQLAASDWSKTFASNQDHIRSICLPFRHNSLTVTSFMIRWQARVWTRCPLQAMHIGIDIFWNLMLKNTKTNLVTSRRPQMVACKQERGQEKSYFVGQFEVQVVTPPKVSLGIHALDPSTHNGDQIEVNGKVGWFRGTDVLGLSPEVQVLSFTSNWVLLPT